jgi:hypothetical protein
MVSEYLGVAAVEFQDFLVVCDPLLQVIECIWWWCGVNAVKQTVLQQGVTTVQASVGGVVLNRATTSATTECDNCVTTV